MAPGHGGGSPLGGRVMRPPLASPAPPASRINPGDQVLRVSSHALLAGAKVLEIEHNGTVYRLQRTALGKLLLTK